ncbi:cytochrome P450 family oxidoreductase [Rhizoctonia solani AG-3 Rhs1AP]|uniref:Cytochrome P450 family oxidoreductase n=1 Tax=Rhizoctonia solani AG-3 Rhs1AP TaxID=1086054 RepID=X8JB29_9AGAM|nr:cytochrome P450 family oxidoreductase [Rhizoctonia solani AG-3 Rhs1AP]
MPHLQIPWPSSKSPWQREDPTISITSICILLGCCVVLVVYRTILQKNWLSPVSLPPSPPRHWFWGNKAFLNKPYRHVLLGTVYKQELGDIISAVTPTRTTVYVNTMELATELLEKQTAATSGRPRDVMANEILGWGTSPAFRKHDEQHKKMRRVMASALHPAAARSYASQHLDTTLGFLRAVAASPDSFMDATNGAVGSFIMRLAYGYVSKTTKDPLLAMVHESFRYLGIATSTYFLVNDFPILRYLPRWFPGAHFQEIGKIGHDMRIRYANETFNMVFDQVRKGQVERPSYVSGLLESKGAEQANEEDVYLIKWTAASLFTAGSTTTASIVNSFFLMAALYPEITQKAQAEIDSVVGRERIPSLQDRSSLPYTDAMVQEVMRMCPPVPLGLAHLATEDIEFHGYRIPKGTTINPNIWAILRDPNHFSLPHIFNPARFLGSKPEPDPRKYIFGFGRRVCPGSHVANNGAWILCAGILSVFDIRPSPQLEAKVASLGGRESNRLFELTEPHGLL